MAAPRSPAAGPAAAELLGVDLGTSGVKVGLFGRRGELLAFARRDYPLRHPEGQPGAVEQDPEDWWAALRGAVGAVLGEHDPSQLRAICAGGQGPVLVLVDAAGRPVRPAISWMDTRAEPQRAEISARLGYEVTAYSLVPKLAWVAQHEPGALEATRWALQAWDFVGFRLSGTAVASTFPGGEVWPAEWLAAAGLPGIPVVPPLVVAGQPYAVTGGRWSAELGLPAGVPVVAGVNDGTGSMVGAAGGVPGRATDVGGQSGGLSVCWDEPLSLPGLVCWPSFVPGTYVLGGAFVAGGSGAVDWWTGLTGGSLPDTLAAAGRAPAGAGGLVFLPFLAGERAPYWDPSARGAFLGLTFEHTADHLARAVVESSGYGLRLLADRIVAGGARIDELRVAGGQARSPVWNRAKADITGLEVLVPAVTEVALMGSAIHAAVGAGLYPDPLVAGEAMVQVASRLAPRPATRALYADLFGVYAGAYAALRPFFPRLGRAAEAGR
jgi:xylulokinase